MTNSKKAATVKPAKAAPGPKTSEAIQRAVEKRDDLPLRPFFLVETGEGGKPQLAPAHSDVEGHSAWLMASLGTTSASFLMHQLNSLDVLTRGQGDDSNIVALNSSLAMLGGIDPQNELEGALATQMVGCHSLAMTMLCRASTTSRTDHLELYSNLAIKLQRTFTAQVEAMARLRGKGQQTVRVEHVTVHPGAQAIVGDVHHHSPGGRGGQKKSEVQPYGPAENAAETQECAALPSPDPAGNGVPIPSDAQRSVPSPRRTVTRRAAGKSARTPARKLHPRDG